MPESSLPSPSRSGPDPALLATSPPSERFDSYIRTRLLGRGGMGEVWLAWDTTLNRWAALKFLHSREAAETERFRREAQTAGSLSHPNIAAVYGVGTAQGQPYIAMQYIDGPSLKHLPRTDRRHLAELIRDAARAVQVAHNAGVIHRDIKPENLMVDSHGRLFVMDFGLARPVTGSGLTISGAAVGTPHYMAPEQARGDRVIDGRCDIYGLGATLYELLTDRPPIEGSDLCDLLLRVNQVDPAPVRSVNRLIDADLETITMKCLEKEPARRYASAADLADDLTRWLDGEHIAAAPPSIVRRTAKILRRRLPIVMAAAAAVAAGIIALPFWIRESNRRAESDRRLVEAGQTREADLQRRERARPHVEAGRRAIAELRLRRTRPYEEPEIAGLAARARKDFENALREDPKCAEAELGIAHAWMAEKEPSKARDAVDRAIALSPTFASAYLDRARLRLPDYEELRHRSGGGVRPETTESLARRLEIEKDLESARQHLQEASDAQFAKASLQFAKGDYLEAALSFEEYGRLVPADAEAHYWRGHALYHVGRMKEAEAALTAAIDYDRGYTTAHALRGSIRKDAGRWDEALADLSFSIGRTPGASCISRITRASVFLERGDVAAATEDCRVALQEHRRCPDALNMLGRLADRRGDRAEALRHYDQVLAIEPDSIAARTNRASVLIELGRPEEAMREFDEIIRLDPMFAPAYVNRGVAHSEAGRDAEAAADFDRAVQLDPKLADAWFNRAVLRKHRGLAADARRDLDRVLELDPRHARARFQIAELLYEERDFRGAIDELDRLLNMHPKMANALTTRGDAHASLGEEKEAEADYTRALDIDPRHPGAWLNRGVVRHNAGRLKEAIADYEQALQWAPKGWEFLKNARQYLQQARAALGKEE